MIGAWVDATVAEGVVRIALAGEVDLSNADAVETALGDAITNQTTQVTIDLTETTYLDSAGLRVLFQLVARLDTLQIDVRLVAPLGSPSRRVVELSGLAALVPVDPATETAR